MLPLQHSPPPVIQQEQAARANPPPVKFCKILGHISWRRPASGSATSTHRAEKETLRHHNVCEGSMSDRKKGLKGKRRAGIWARLLWHADGPNNIKNLRFWYKCVSRWFWDFPGAIGELYPCPVYALITSARSGRKAHLQPETQLTQQICLL